MKMKKRAQLALTFLFVFSIILSGCSGNGNGGKSSEGGSSTQQENPPASSSGGEVASEEKQPDPVTIRVVRWGATDDANRKVELDEFQKMYPWITVKDEVVAAGTDDLILERMAALQAAGTPADVIWLNEVVTYMKDGLLEDLKPFMENDPLIQNAKLPEGAMESMQLAGKQLALPRANPTTVMFVNKDMLAKYGMEMPGNDWTYDDLREMAKTATDPNAGEYGLGDQWMHGMYLAWMMSTANGNSPNLSFMNEDFSQSVGNRPEVLADMLWVQEMQTKDGSLISIEESAAMGWDHTSNAFIQGKVLFDMMLESGASKLHENAKFNWDVLPMPYGKVKQVTQQWTAGAAMASASKYKDAAYKYLTFVYTKEAQKLAIARGAIPLTNDPELNELFKQGEVWQGKNIDAVLTSATLCCTVAGMTTPVWSEYFGGLWSWGLQAFFGGADLNTTVVPEVEKWNKRTLEVRKELGL